ncbi:restriction endonuclease subunit S [Anabaenopsis sp. FSS-46]|uniref:restriction endonuclease subunit S n=1 Tax=Anabaenopsis sp. FSS-46 TaxID=2971766 RepID=UPI0024748452|nr:restriction endonuclease subunit S [Anabaenopsis sp. FSS-46]MDH6099561.1 restriction endonuclease subunit S [Anabaenopsis sp. FSS-46]
MSQNIKIKLFKVASIFNGKTPSRLEQRINGYPVLKIKDVSEDGNFGGVFESFVDLELADKFATKKIVSGDILILNAAHNADYVGKKIYKTEPCVEGALATGEWMIIRADAAVIDFRYLYYWLLSGQTKYNIRHLVKGIHLYPKDVAKLEIPLPPLEEQRRIAAILDKADDIRRKRKQAIALTEELLRSTFLDMFGDPVTNPKGWPYCNLSELLSIVSGQINPQADPYVNMQHIGCENIHANTGQIIGVKTPKELKLHSGKYLFEPTDVLYSKIRPYLNKVTIPGFTGVCSADIYPLRVKESKLDQRFLVYMLRSNLFLTYAEKHSTRTNIPKINRLALLNFNFPYPPLTLQKQFSVIYSKVDSLRNRIEYSCQDLDNLFNSLLQKAFRGEL